MTMRAYTVRFIGVQVHATSEADAVRAAATLIVSDPDVYTQQVLIWVSDEDGKTADTPPDYRHNTS